MLRVPVSKEAIVMTLTILCILWRQTNGRVIEKETKALPIPEGVITQCRLSCLNKFSVETDSSNVLPQSCSSINHCMMCWDFCETLYIQKRTIFKSMCTNPTCLLGCKYACGYYRQANWLSYISQKRPTIKKADNGSSI